MAWERDRGSEFTYDGIRLLSMLEEYTLLRQEKELERKRQRDQKKLQEQLIAEQEAIYGSKPSPMKCQSGKKGPRLSCGGGASNRRLSLGVGGTAPRTDFFQPPKATPNTRQAKKNDRSNHNDHANHRDDDGVGALSAGRRGLDIAGLPVKKHSFGAGAANSREVVDSPIVRKPFSPISSTDSSKSNAANMLEDLNKKHNEMLQKTITAPLGTPSKIISSVEEENRTPKTIATPLLSTPATVSVPMQTAMTPATAAAAPPSAVALALNYSKPADEIPEEIIEYSFEERRAGFVLPKTPQKTVILQV